MMKILLSKKTERPVGSDLLTRILEAGGSITSNALEMIEDATNGAVSDMPLGVIYDDGRPVIVCLSEMTERMKRDQAGLDWVFGLSEPDGGAPAAIHCTSEYNSVVMCHRGTDGNLLALIRPIMKNADYAFLVDGEWRTAFGSMLGSYLLDMSPVAKK